MEARSGSLRETALIPFLRLLQHSRFVPVCFVVFVGIRLGLILFVPTAEPLSDAAWYLNRAIGLAEQGTYNEGGILTAHWPVGYPAFLALLFRVTGVSVRAAQVANLLLAATSFWLLYFVVRRSLHDELVARGAVLLVTVYPNNAAYVPVLLTESLFTFLLLLAGCCLLTGRRWQHVLLGGCTLGLATLVKTQTILLIPLFAFVATLDDWSVRDFARAMVRAVAVTVVAVVVVTPWAVRNYNVFGTVTLATSGGINLLASNNPSVVGDYWHDISENDPLFKKANRDIPADQVGTHQRARALAIGWIKDNPGQFLRLIPKKLFRLWAPDGEAEWDYQDTPFYERHKVSFRAARVVNQVFYVVALLLFVPALWKLLTIRLRPVTYLGLAVVAFVTLVSVIFSGQSRYHFPAMPFVLAYVAWGLVGLGAPRTSRPQELLRE